VNGISIKAHSRSTWARGCRVFKREIEAALGRNSFEEFADGVVAVQPDELGQFPRFEVVLVAEEDLFQAGLFKGADHAAGMAMQVDVQGAVEVAFGPFQDLTIQGVRWGLIDQQSAVDSVLQFPVEFGDRLSGRLAGGDHGSSFVCVAAFQSHQRANGALQIQGQAAGVGGAPICHIVEGKQFELGWSEELRMAAENYPYQSGAGARGRQDEDHPGVSFRIGNGVKRGQWGNQAAEDRQAVLVDLSAWSGAVHQFLASIERCCRFGIVAAEIGSQFGDRRRLEQSYHVDHAV